MQLCKLCLTYRCCLVHCYTKTWSTKLCKWLKLTHVRIFSCRYTNCVSLAALMSCTKAHNNRNKYKFAQIVQKQLQMTTISHLLIIGLYCIFADGAMIWAFLLNMGCSIDIICSVLLYIWMWDKGTDCCLSPVTPMDHGWMHMVDSH